MRTGELDQNEREIRKRNEREKRMKEIENGRNGKIKGFVGKTK